MHKPLIAVVMAAVLFATASCTGSPPETDSSADGAATEVDQAGLKRAQDIVKEFLDIPEFVAPGEALDGTKIGGGKKMLVVPSAGTLPYNVAFVESVKAAAELVGIDAEIYETQGNSDGWARAVEYGVSQKVDAIALVAGLNVENIRPQIVAAEAAGIPVIASTYQGVGLAHPDFLTASVPLDYGLAGQLQANYAIADTEGNANILIVDSSDLRASQSLTPRVIETLKENCPACTYTTIDIPVVSWASEIKNQVTAAITADPSINYILPNYDAMAFDVIAALQLQGKVGKIGIATFNGTPSSLELISSGDLTADVGQDIAWTGFATVDAALRVWGQVEPSSGVIEENIPMRIFDASNVEEAGTPPSYENGFGSAADEYRTLWGLT